MNCIRCGGYFEPTTAVSNLCYTCRGSQMTHLNSTEIFRDELEDLKRRVTESEQLRAKLSEAEKGAGDFNKLSEALDFIKLAEDLVKSEQRVRELEAYIQHKKGCPLDQYGEFCGFTCTCGLDALKSKLSSEGKAQA